MANPTTASVDLRWFDVDVGACGESRSLRVLLLLLRTRAGDHDAPVSGFRVEWYRADSNGSYVVLTGALDFRKDEVRHGVVLLRGLMQTASVDDCGACARDRPRLERGSIKQQ